MDWNLSLNVARDLARRATADEAFAAALATKLTPADWALTFAPAPRPTNPVRAALNAWYEAPTSKKRWLAVIEAAATDPRYIVSEGNLWIVVGRPYQGRGFGRFGDWTVKAKRFNRKHKHYNRTAAPFPCPDALLPKGRRAN